MRDKIDKMMEDARELVTGSTVENDLRARLHADHSDVAIRLDELIATDDAEIPVREEIRAEIVTLLTTHARAEEEVVYTFLQREAEVRGETQHAVREHRDIDEALARVRTASVADTNFIELCRELKRVVTHHVHEEETDLLPKAEKEFGQERLAKLIPQFNRRKAELLGNTDLIRDNSERQKARTGSRSTDRGLDDAVSQY